MMAGGNILGRMWAWGALLLAVILAHALLPIAPPNVKTSGSPFSASTLDVSTAPTRRTLAAAQQQALPDGGDDVEQSSVVAFVQPVPATIVRAAVRARDPPLRSDPTDAPYPPGSSLPQAPPLS